MINHELVDAMVAGTRSSRPAIIAAFRDSTATDMQRLRAAVAAQAGADIALNAHRLRGACEMLGAAAVAQASLALERAARTDPTGLHAAMRALEEQVRALDDYLGTLDGA